LTPATTSTLIQPASPSAIVADSSLADFAHQEIEVPMGEQLERPSLLSRAIVLAAIVIPILGLIAATVLLWGPGFGWVYLGVLLGGYVLTALGISIGYHRLFTHKSFTTPAPVKAILGILGSMAVEGPILHWVATHRKHHQHSDRAGDPHSPNHSFHDHDDHGAGVLGIIKGFWHAHMGWIFESSPEKLDHYVPDLKADAVTRTVSNLFPLWVALGLLIPAVIALAITGTWMGFLLGFLWGGLVRVLLVHHITWSVNSVCHLWGTRPYRSHDDSRNNVIFGILGMGEGWHNNHHAFPTSARHGLRWWQIDVSYMIIKAMSWMGLAQAVRVPDAARLESKRIRRGPSSR